MADRDAPLRLMIYDNTCRGAYGLPGLTHSWWLGGHIYKLLGRLDAFCGVSSWEEGLAWLADFKPERPIGEIQFWGHGHWGCVYIDRIPLDDAVLYDAHPWHEWMLQIKDRMSGPDALWWFRTCETFGAERGHAFARDFSSFMGCRAAGHTFIIGPWQSGLHCLGPGQEPLWDPHEGLAEGTPDRPSKALWSTPFRTHTIFCLTGHIPPAWDQTSPPD